MPAFDILNWPYSVKKISIVPGYTNQSTGAWVAEVTTETAVSAHVSDVTQKELRYLDPAVVADGVRKIALEQSVGLLAGDRVKITEAGGEETEWFVHARQDYSGLLGKHAGIKRETFLLRRLT